MIDAIIVMQCAFCRAERDADNVYIDQREDDGSAWVSATCSVCDTESVRRVQPETLTRLEEVGVSEEKQWAPNEVDRLAVRLLSATPQDVIG